jgi:protein subunit release factor A
LKIKTKKPSGEGGKQVKTIDSSVRIVLLPTGKAVETGMKKNIY